MKRRGMVCLLRSHRQGAPTGNHDRYPLQQPSRVHTSSVVPLRPPPAHLCALGQLDSIEEAAESVQGARLPCRRARQPARQACVNSTALPVTGPEQLLARCWVAHVLAARPAAKLARPASFCPVSYHAVPCCAVPLTHDGHPWAQLLLDCIRELLALNVTQHAELQSAQQQQKQPRC